MRGPASGGPWPLLVALLLWGTGAPAASAQDTGAPADGADPAAEDPAAAEARRLLDGRAFVTVEPRVDTAYPGQVVPLEITVGVEARFLEQDVLSAFRRAVDLPLQLDWGTAEGLRPWPAADARHEADRDPGLELRSLSLGDELARVPVSTETRGSRTFRVLRLVRHVLPEAPGVLPLPEARLRFAFATRFREDWLQGRLPEDRHAADLRAPRHGLLVLAQPTVGRPEGFAGAVGPLGLEVRPGVERGTYGQGVPLVVELRGPGDLHAFPAPELELGPDWTLLGVLEGREPGLRRLTYELLPRRGGELVLPGVALDVFEPLPAPAYRELRAPRRVLPVDGGPPEGAADPLDGGAVPLDPEARRARTSGRLLAWGLFALGSLAALLLVGVRREPRGEAPDGPLPPRARAPHDRDPLGTLVRDLGRDPDAATRDRALRRYLAVRLGRPLPRVEAGDLERDWSAAGLDGAGLAPTREALLALRRARYGEPGGGPAELPDVRALAEALEDGRRP